MWMENDAESLRFYPSVPKKSVVLGFRTTSLTRFVENTCDICVSK